MPTCQRLKQLQDAAAAASLRSRLMMEVSERLPTVTGFSADRALDLIGGSLKARKRACAELAHHADLHECDTTNCDWPAPDCRGCRRMHAERR